jgi:hypothetical protein
MRLIWTKNYLPLSVAIRGITGEDCSHFAFVFESQARSLVFQSNLLGTNVEFYSKLNKAFGFSLVHQVEIKLSDKEEDAVWDVIVNKYSDVGYNFLGAIYLGWRYLLKRIFRLPLTAKNKWTQPGTMFCDQVYQVLNQISSSKLPYINVMGGMDTPFVVWERVSGARK